MSLPDWASLILVWGTGLVGMMYVLIGRFWLKRKYEGPYTLRVATSNQKWRWAIKIAMFEIAFAIFGLLALMLFGSPSIFVEDTQTYYLVYCIPAIVVVFIGVILFERWEMESILKEYMRIDRWRKDPTNPKLKPRMTKSLALIAFASEDYRRFLEEGYRDE